MVSSGPGTVKIPAVCLHCQTSFNGIRTTQIKGFFIIKLNVSGATIVMEHPPATPHLPDSRHPLL